MKHKLLTPLLVFAFISAAGVASAECVKTGCTSGGDADSLRPRPVVDRWASEIEWPLPEWGIKWSFTDTDVQRVKLFVFKIDGDVQNEIMLHTEVILDWEENTRGYIFIYPRNCNDAAAVGIRYLTDEFGDEFDIYEVNGYLRAPTYYRGRYGQQELQHTWLLISINKKLYYISFTDGLFAWNNNEQRARRLELLVGNREDASFHLYKTKFLEPFCELGLNKVVFLPWDEISKYFKIESNIKVNGSGSKTKLGFVPEVKHDLALEQI